MDGDIHWEVGRLYKESCFGANQAQWDQAVLYLTNPALGRQEDSPLSAFLHLSQLRRVSGEPGLTFSLCHSLVAKWKKILICLCSVPTYEILICHHALPVICELTVCISTSLLDDSIWVSPWYFKLCMFKWNHHFTP